MERDGKRGWREVGWLTYAVEDHEFGFGEGGVEVFFAGLEEMLVSWRDCRRRND